MHLIKSNFNLYFQKCVDKDPAKRLTCEQLLAHPFFRNFSFKYPELEDYEGQKRVRERDRARVSLKHTQAQIKGLRYSLLAPTFCKARLDELIHEAITMHNHKLIQK